MAILLNGTKESLSEITFSQAALLSSVLLVCEAELKNSRERKNELEAQLSPEFTFATKEIGRVVVSEKPVFPKKSTFVILGTFIGLLLTLLWVFLKLNVNNNREYS